MGFGVLSSVFTLLLHETNVKTGNANTTKVCLQLKSLIWLLVLFVKG
jgi:hypothetical protein